MTDIGTTDLSAALRTSISRVTRRIRSLRADGDLGAAAMAVLGVLVKEGPLTLTALSDRERVTPASASQSVNRLAADRLVERAPDPDDGRRVLLSATERGRVVFDEARGPAREWFDARLAELSDRDRRTLGRAAEILDRVAAS